MIPLTKEEKRAHCTSRRCYECKKTLVLMITIKNMIRLEIIVIMFADVLENFRNMFIIVYELDPANFLSAS